MRAQDDPLKDPDLQQMLKQAQDLQKENGPAKTPVKMSDLQKQADAIQAEQKEEEKKEKAARQKQLEAPRPGRVTRLDSGDSAIPPKQCARQENGR